MKANNRSFNFVILCVCLTFFLRGQNNLILQLDNGSPFKVLVNEKVYNNSAQSQVELKDLSQDTLFVKIELEKGERFGVTLYLLDKGKKTSGKEFNFVLHREKTRLRPVFMGMYDKK